MKKRFYSNGKLLLTGEYLVLDGARALALPTKFGQDLTVAEFEQRKIFWKSFDHDGSIWFQDVLTFEEIENQQQSAHDVKSTLLKILHEAFKLRGEFLDSAGYTIETRLTFPKFWGLGTSSTLINNIAQWLSVDAFKLLQNSFGGSGYDIAAAQNNTAIIYQLENGVAKVEPVAFDPPFKDHLYFVYLNRKQSSKAAILSYYNNSVEDLGNSISTVNKITDNILHAKSASAFSRELERHENLLSNILEMQTVREAFFSDFDGTVKSLGGWGGDFILAVSNVDPTNYFKLKGFSTVIPYSEMVLK